MGSQVRLFFSLFSSLRTDLFVGSFRRSRHAARPVTATPAVVHTHDAAPQAVRFVSQFPPSQPLCALRRRPGHLQPVTQPARPLQAHPNSLKPVFPGEEALDSPPAHGEAPASAAAAQSTAAAGAVAGDWQRLHQAGQRQSSKSKVESTFDRSPICVRKVRCSYSSFLACVCAETLRNSVLDMEDCTPAAPFPYLTLREGIERWRIHASTHSCYTPPGQLACCAGELAHGTLGKVSLPPPCRYPFPHTVSSPAIAAAAPSTFNWSWSMQG